MHMAYYSEYDNENFRRLSLSYAIQPRINLTRDLVSFLFRRWHETAISTDKHVTDWQLDVSTDVAADDFAI